MYQFVNLYQLESGVNPADHIAGFGGFVTDRKVQVGTTHHDAVTKRQWIVDVPGHWE